MTSIILSAQDIQRLLPHRYPFLLVDRMIELVAKERGVGIKNITFNEPQFLGHFPQNPIMPGVLLIEALAQAAALVALYGEPDPQNHAIYFMSIEKAKFRKPAVPGDCVYLEVEHIQHRGPVWKFSGKAKVEGKVIAEACFSAMLRDTHDA